MKREINFILHYCFIFICVFSFSNASISGYSETAAVESSPTMNCGDIDSTSEAKATDSNPFCVYPALVGDHPSPPMIDKVSQGPIKSLDFEAKTLII
uniref:Uncharacterized protein n=2 Tax=Meloidogyne TaxID=189290 RepID=A0A6V7VNM8_MELEN|nr:unnamed protein product [Meloidogyne enterolobii]